MKIVYFLSLLFLLNIDCKKNLDEVPDPKTYVNPLLDSGPDPWVIQKDSFYYFTHTSGDKITIRKTKSVSRLSAAEQKVAFVATASGPFSHALWAPELHFLDNKWYLYFSSSPTSNVLEGRLRVFENASDNPLEGTWVFKGTIKDPTYDYFAIDPTILQLNNKKYLIWCSFPNSNAYIQSIFIAEMANPWTLKSNRVLISTPQYPWEKFGGYQDGGINEGPEIIKNPNGKVFVVYSASSCWTDQYSLGLLELKSGEDPLKPENWIKKNTSIFSTFSGNRVYGPGHNSFFKSPDGKEDWIIYHAHTSPGQPCDNSRAPHIQKFTWNNDGSPNFGQPVPSYRRFPRPSGEKD